MLLLAGGVWHWIHTVASQRHTPDRVLMVRHEWSPWVVWFAQLARRKHYIRA